MKLSVLEKLGLDKKEVEIYLTNLNLGPSSLRKLAGVTGINRGTVYNILKKLMKQELITFYKQDKQRYYVASDPSNLEAFLEEQISKLKSTKNELKKVLPELKSLYNDAGAKPKVQYFEGKKGVKRVLKDLLETLGTKSKKERNYQVYSTDEVKSFLYECYPGFTDERIKAGVKVDVISLSPGGQLCGLDKRKWVPGTLKTVPTYMLIYAEKIALISKGESEIMTVLIDSVEISATQSIIFEALWERI